MTDETRRTGGEPVFDPERAWERFARLTAREPVPAFWRQAAAGLQADEAATNIETSPEDRHKPHLINNHNSYKKDGVLQMPKSNLFRTPPQSPVAGAAGAAEAATLGTADGGWRTEKPAKRRLRRFATGAVAATLVIGLFTTPLGERALAAMQQTFRIQHMVGVGISADDLAAISSVLDHGSPEGDRSFDLAQYGSLTESGGGETRTVTWDEASRQMGAPLLRPENAAAPTYQPAGTLIFTLNVQAVNRLLTRLGSAGTLPEAADSKAIRLYIPAGVVTSGTLAGKPVKLLQFGKPELTMENGIDAAAIREAVLSLPVLPDSLRTKLAAIGDWQSTLPVPAREGSSANLRFDGHDAILSVDGQERYLLWLDESRMVLLSGDTQDFPSESGFLQAAEGLVRP